jgi:hypothetical protein
METPSPPLNDIQLSLLKLFSRPMSEAQTLSLKKVLIDFYDKLLQEEVEKSIQEKHITDADFEAILNKQQRSS